MSTEVKINAEPRTCSGSTAARRLRRAGIIPAVLAKIDGTTELIQLNSREFEQVMSGYGDAQIMVSITVDGDKRLALLREIQRNDLTGRISHADFSMVDTSTKLRLQIQVLLTGEPEGVRLENGVLEQQLRQIEIECLPSDAIESTTIDTSDLKLGDDITVAALDLGPDIDIITPAETVICNVAMVVEEVEEEEVEEDGEAEDAQPELSVQKGKSDDEDSGDA
ncbi:MAG: 50S ribosomal protein L25 [Lentisphaerae bacterium]|jgi:large subunit ribosomal protein L25|nr:50S ribosomal protein L25 [Lentisphaerota bacterium]